MFITTTGYTKEALKEADKFKINCRGENWVVDRIVKWQEKEAKKLGLVG